MFFLAARFWPPIPQLVPFVCSSWFPRICGEGGCRLAHNLIPNKEKTTTKQLKQPEKKRKWQLLLLPRTKENEATLALTLLHQTMTPTLALCAASSE